MSDPCLLASAILDTAAARIVSADADSVTLDHVAMDAIVATAGALETAATDVASAALLLEEIGRLLSELPPNAGHGLLGELLRERAVARARAAAE